MVCFKYYPTADKVNPLCAHTFWSALSTNSRHACSVHGLCLLSPTGTKAADLEALQSTKQLQVLHRCLLFLRRFLSVFCLHQEPSPADGKAKDAGEAPRGGSPPQPGKAAPVKGSVSDCNQGTHRSQAPCYHHQYLSCVNRAHCCATFLSLRLSCSHDLLQTGQISNS